MENLDTIGNQNTNKNNNFRNQNFQKWALTNPATNDTNNNTNKCVPLRRPRFDRKCNHCRQWGHKKEDCWILKKELCEKQESEKASLMCTLVLNDYSEIEVALINKIRAK